jgi:uncharacterized protein YcbK (DUF882 family)
MTRNFKLSEFIESDTAERLGIDNTPPDWAVENIRLLCEKLLQPLRSLYGKAMIVNSGYRCKELNEAVGGVETSFHRKGLAADIRCDNPKQLLQTLLSAHIKFDQAVLYPTFLHLSYDKARNRMQVIKK